MFNNFFFFVNRAVYKMWKHTEESDRPTDYNKAQNNLGYKHSEYVIFIAIPRQTWLRERARMLRYTYTACLVCCYFGSTSHTGNYDYSRGRQLQENNTLFS
jgi:hypothetical protein